MNATLHDLLAVQRTLNALGDQAAAEAPIQAPLATLARALDALLAEQALLIARLMHANDRLYTVVRQMAEDDPQREPLWEALNSVRWALYPELAEEILAATKSAGVNPVRPARTPARPGDSVETDRQAAALAARLERDALELTTRVRLSKLHYRED